ncbi:hypothetical protein KRMM14A1004_15650 [Krasilnikovia sp. MM14-A1004]
MGSVWAPWVRLHIPEDSTFVSLGSPLTYARSEVRTYGFAGLQGARIDMVADWALLLVLVALSWRLPRWRRPLAITASVLAILLVIVMFGAGTAIAHSLVAGQDLPSDADPYNATIDYLGGLWLGFIGTAALVAAVVLPDAPTQNDSAAKDRAMSPNGHPTNNHLSESVRFPG